MSDQRLSLVIGDHHSEPLGRVATLAWVFNPTPGADIIPRLHDAKVSTVWPKMWSGCDFNCSFVTGRNRPRAVVRGVNETGVDSWHRYYGSYTGLHLIANPLRIGCHL